ncbi:MAG: tRNA preQ1(34) S-adenosylmethionine ribosyltransferase-isomerase QueA [Eubacteriales bacterium]|nr:tRNA preQ1(34) S-adenosylmethionine ribosyltransferase-isomerase QueA [Eubacteriales bacterium]
MKTHDFFYELPKELIAQTPVEPRDHSRMIVCGRQGSAPRHERFIDLPEYLRPGDAVVINHTKVIPARLTGLKEGSGIACEALLLKRISQDRWEALVRPGRRLKSGSRLSFGNILQAVIEDSTEFGGRIVRFEYEGVFEEILDLLGQMPLPPYIHEQLSDSCRYQTVYAKIPGSAAAPTAGLHFTPRVLKAIADRGALIIPILLHVGLGTFRPVKVKNLDEHVMHEEYYEVPQEAAKRINEARAKGGRILCVGTTSLRTLETTADENGVIHPGKGMTGIFIKPGHRFKACDMLLTNFHLPESTLLMLVAAFMGLDNALDAYREAVRAQYRFFSFGDCMLIGNALSKG